MSPVDTNADPRFPIGKFSRPTEITPEMLNEYIAELEAFPHRLRKAVENLADEVLDTPYREGGWSLRQVVHHCADSHMNSLPRYKLALTEENPTIKPYFEDRWAELSDSKNLSIEPSLNIISGIHARWVHLLRSMSPEDFKRTFYHPEHKRDVALDVTTALYAWHSNHHLGHIYSVIGWP
jgi:hypothetical protein